MAEAATRLCLGVLPVPHGLQKRQRLTLTMAEGQLRLQYAGNQAGAPSGLLQSMMSSLACEQLMAVCLGTAAETELGPSVCMCVTRYNNSACHRDLQETTSEDYFGPRRQSHTHDP